ncbi:MAG: hypothetical protein P9X22_05520 [Candidatus Zapsychrus exili]|nr:hypothetical protein [Candidatus Zapsychrus exili]
MQNKLLIVLLVVLLMLSGHSLAYACGGSCGCGSRKIESQESKINSSDVEVGNKNCPVMGKKIGEGNAVKIKHESKVYNLCCAGCIDIFKKDPKKYIEKIDASMQEPPQDDVCGEIQSCHG